MRGAHFVGSHSSAHLGDSLYLGEQIVTTQYFDIVDVAYAIHVSGTS
jgi:hypothetical protein